MVAGGQAVGFLRWVVEQGAGAIRCSSWGGPRQCTLESYKKAVRDNGRLVISTDSEFFNYLKKAK
ncbi:MAG: hypothetical protein Kow00100_13480 [Geothermobacteraceae bacterium]